MVTRSLDVRKKALTPIPISYLIQTANRFDCDIFVTNDQKTANLKQYDELKDFGTKYKCITFCDNNGATSIWFPKQ